MGTKTTNMNSSKPAQHNSMLLNQQKKGETRLGIRNRLKSQIIISEKRKEFRQEQYIIVNGQE
jgi:hypothetical protein